MRAREPDHAGYAVHDGVRLYYEVFGTGEPTLLLLPTWNLFDSRHWKMQVPYLSRRNRVVTFDPRGNGRSDRPDRADGYTLEAHVADIRAVMAEVGVGDAVLLSFCTGSMHAMALAAEAPGAVRALVAISPNWPLTPPLVERTVFEFEHDPGTAEGWAKCTRAYWKADWPGFVEFFCDQIVPERYSTKAFDDMVGWGLQTDAQTMLHGEDVRYPPMTLEQAEQACRDLACPVLVVTGDRDRIMPVERSRRFAELTGARLLELKGSGHAPHVRHPVVVNHAVREFVDALMPPRPRSPWLFARQRKRRVLWVSSPIGLGHVRRDLAIAAALRERVPDLEIEWWAQPPVTDVVRAAGEIVHPVSEEMASESAHWESAAHGHELHAFQAFRSMDEIFLANYMLFDDVVRETPYDLWIGDESWEVDHFLHENPDRKIAPYVFTTDVVGFLPTDPDDAREAEVCADYNAEQIEHRERFPYVRDLSLFIGATEELPDTTFGAGLPGIREWTSRWYDDVPYIVPFDPADLSDRDALRARHEYAAGEPLVVATVGGTAAGRDLLDLVAEGFAHLRKQLPEARMLMVCGPRLSPEAFPDVEGLEKHGYLGDLLEHFACADAAVVQGGLSTTMELVALGRPFVYFPLRRHWEQEHHVAHRLDHYRAGIRLDFAATTPADLATALERALRRTKPRYRALRRDGARQAADRIARLIT